MYLQPLSTRNLKYFREHNPSCFLVFVVCVFCLDHISIKSLWGLLSMQCGGDGESFFLVENFSFLLSLPTSLLTELCLWAISSEWSRLLVNNLLPFLL